VFKWTKRFPTTMAGDDSGKKKTHVMTLRIPQDLHDSIKTRSDSENRSRSNLILTYLRMIAHLSPDELKTIIDGKKRRSKVRKDR
jgi:hypothetical protein